MAVSRPPTLTGYEAQILLHYFGHDDRDHPDMQSGHPNWLSARVSLAGRELLTQRPPELGRSAWMLTERGQTLVLAMLDLPMPVAKWVMPKETP